MENPESRDMRMVGEGEPGFPTCLLLLRINKRLEKVYRYTTEYAYYLSPMDLPPFSFSGSLVCDTRSEMFTRTTLFEYGILCEIF
jgi:hypothetical protein